MCQIKWHQSCGTGQLPVAAHCFHCWGQFEHLDWCNHGNHLLQFCNGSCSILRVKAKKGQLEAGIFFLKPILGEVIWPSEGGRHWFEIAGRAGASLSNCTPHLAGDLWIPRAMSLTSGCRGRPAQCEQKRQLRTDCESRDMMRRCGPMLMARPLFTLGKRCERLWALLTHLSVIKK